MKVPKGKFFSEVGWNREHTRPYICNFTDIGAFFSLKRRE
jgi:hypothetical protein